MNILVIPQAYPDESNPSLTPFIKQQADAFAHLGYNVRVLHVKLLPLRRWNKFRKKHEVIEENDIVRLCADMNYIHGLEKYNTNTFYKKTKKLYLYYSEKYGKPDLIISHFYQYAGFAAAMLSEEYSIPLLHIEHAGWLLSNRINRYEKEKLKVVYTRASSFVCVSNSLKESIKKVLQSDDHMIVVPNMISSRYSYNSPTNKDCFVFFSAGNLYEGKRFPLLIEAFCRAFLENENVELRIAGKGHLEPQLRRLIDNSHRTKQIVLLGALDQEHMNMEYTNCDCFVLPSEHETFGIVYREAMACGRPIITTNHQGFVNDWKDDYGIMIEVDNKNELIQALKNMRKNYKHYDGKKISDECLQKYSKDHVVEEYRKIIESL